MKPDELARALSAARDDGREVKVTTVNLAAIESSMGVRVPPPETVDFKYESDFQSAVRELALRHGWDFYHTRDSRRSDKDFPDCVAGKFTGLDGFFATGWVAELKIAPRKPTKGQLRWIKLFHGMGIPAFVWYPQDWPQIVRVITQGLKE